MSKEEFLKIQTCVLKVNIHCDGCKQKVKKILQKIEGVFTTRIDAEQGKVTISGNVDPSILIKKLAKSGKHAELWGAQKTNGNQDQTANQFKNMQIDNGKGGNKGQKGNNNNDLPKGGQQNPQNQLQQYLQQIKGFQDLKLPALKDLKMPNQPNHKGVKFALPEDGDLGDYDDEDYDDDGFDDEMGDPRLNKMNPFMGNGPKGPNHMMNGMHPQLISAQNVANGWGNGKKGEGGGNGAVPVQINIGGANGKNGNTGKKGGGGGNNGGNQNQSGKNGDGKPQDGKNGNNVGAGAGGGNKNSGGGNNMQLNDGKKWNNGGGGGGSMMAGPHANIGPMGNMNIPMGPLENMSRAQMGNVPAVPGLPAAAAAAAAAMNGGSAPGYFQGAGPDLIPGNPYQQQQQYVAAMMNQQGAMGNERFQPMIYARPPPAVNYLPPYPYPYPQPLPHPHANDPYTSLFSDENPSSCNVM